MSIIYIDVNVIVRKDKRIVKTDESPWDKPIHLEYKTYQISHTSLFDHCDSGAELDGADDIFTTFIEDDKYEDGYYEIYGQMELRYSKDYWGEVDVDYDAEKLCVYRLTKDHKEELIEYLDEELIEDILPDSDQVLVKPEMVPFDIVVKDEN